MTVRSGAAAASAVTILTAVGPASSLKEAAVALGYVTPEQYDQWVVPVEMTRPLAT